MSRSSRLVLFTFGILTAFSAPVAARSDDPRLRTVAWRADAVIELVARAGRTLAVMLAPGEQVTGIVVAEPGQFTVERSMDGDGLLVTPRAADARSVLTVTTDLRAYRFDLVARDDATAPLIVRLTYPRGSNASTTSAAPSPTSGWKLSGNRNLRPSAIRDDGARTTIVWGDDQAIPAVFALTAGGREEVVDGYMRDGAFVIDRVPPRLVFRIDRDAATAVREVRRR